MTETGERVCCSESLKLQSGCALLPFQTLRSISALVGIHLKKEKSCLKKRSTSLIAEKYRAILQQVKRKRNRRQDVYDLDLLIVGNQMDDSYRAQILDAFIEKCRARHINPTRTSLDDPEIKKRSGTDWQTMELELGEVPDFEDCFARVSQFYRDLPWQIERTTEE